MKTNKNELFLKISGIISIIVGVLFSITIIGLIIGIPLFIAAGKYFKWAKLSDEELLNEKQDLIIWGVILAIFTFPFGLVALVPAFNLEGELSNMVNSNKSKENAPTDITTKLQKLQDLKDTGVITEEEFKLAKEKVLRDL